MQLIAKKEILIVAVSLVIHCCAIKKNVTVASRLYDVADVRGRSRGGDWPPKTYGSNFFHHGFYNSENSIQDIRRFCSPFVFLQQCCEV